MSEYKLENLCCCPPDPPVLNQTILVCGSGSGITLPIYEDPCCQLANPHVIANLSIDTGALANPRVKLDFSTIINYKESGSLVVCGLRLIFQLSRVCAGTKIALGSWNFVRKIKPSWGVGPLNAEMELKHGPGPGPGPGPGGIFVETVDSFGFTFCDCQACPGCCSYLVEIIHAQTNGVDFASISNPILNAIAVGPLG